MTEACAHLPPTVEDRLDALANAASLLDLSLLGSRDEALCNAAARLVDSVLAPLARGCGAVDIAIGEGLDALQTRSLELGYAGTGDYAREELGIPASTAVKMVLFSRRLRECPRVRPAVWSGELTPRKAQAILAVARGDAEDQWLLMPRRVRLLTALTFQAVRKEAGSGRARPSHQVPFGGRRRRMR